MTLPVAMPLRKDSMTPSLNEEVKSFLLLNGYRKTYLVEHIWGLISIYSLRGLKSDRAFGHIYDIIFIDNITTDHLGRFQKMWGHHDFKVPEYKEW